MGGASLQVERSGASTSFVTEQPVEFKKTSPVLPHLVAEVTKMSPSSWDRVQGIATRSLQTLSLVPALAGPATAGPISAVFGAVQAFNHIDGAIGEIKEGRVGVAIYHFLQAAVSVATIAMAFFKPMLALGITSISNFVDNIKNAAIAFDKGNIEKGFESLFGAALNLTVLALLSSPCVELTVAVLALQSLFTAYRSYKDFSQGKIIEGILDMILLGATTANLASKTVEAYDKHIGPEHYERGRSHGYWSGRVNGYWSGYSSGYNRGYNSGFWYGKNYYGWW